MRAGSGPPFSLRQASFVLCRLAASATRLSASLPPREALREWMRLFVDYVATKKVMAAALGSIVGAGRRRRRSGAGEAANERPRESAARPRAAGARRRLRRPRLRGGRGVGADAVLSRRPAGARRPARLDHPAGADAARARLCRGLARALPLARVEGRADRRLRHRRSRRRARRRRAAGRSSPGRIRRPG